MSENFKNSPFWTFYVVRIFLLIFSLLTCHYFTIRCFRQLPIDSLSSGMELCLCDHHVHLRFHCETCLAHTIWSKSTLARVLALTGAWERTTARWTTQQGRGITYWTAKRNYPGQHLVRSGFLRWSPCRFCHHRCNCSAGIYPRLRARSCSNILRTIFLCVYTMFITKLAQEKLLV